MGDNELLYVVLAIMLFGGLTTSINKYLGFNNVESLRTEAESRAIAIAQEVIEDAKTRKFDENITTPQDGFDANNAPTSFSSAQNLTNESEQWPSFDDIDDYSGGWENKSNTALKRTVDTDLGEFGVSTVVNYVTPDNLAKVRTGRQYFKKLSVTVSNEYLAEDITLEHVYAFWNLN
jgi:hypothetical protein